MTRKIFRIIKTGWPNLRYRIEQRHTIFFFIHFWSRPEFERPHVFASADDATKAIWIRYPDGVIYDNYSGNEVKNY